MQGLLKSIPDLERIAARIALGSVRPKELAALRAALLLLPQIAGLLQNQTVTSCQEKPNTEGLLSQIAQQLQIDAGVQDLLAQLMEEPATQVRDGGVFAYGVNEELDQLRNLGADAAPFLLAMEARERARSGINTLRIEYNKVSGYYIEVSRAAANSDQIPADYRRRQTLKNAERFITPELKAFEDQALSAKDRALTMEKALYEALLHNLLPFVPSLQFAASAIAGLDVLCAWAQHATQYHWHIPELTNVRGIAITAGRHPVLEARIERFTPNDCHIGDLENVDGVSMQLITGPNMGGKSTYMRQVALIALLAWCGCPVPAQVAKIGPLDKILTRIGASDDLASGQSTFMVEMSETASILHQATPHSLVLVDEVGRGTSTFDGVALASAIAQHLALQSQSMTLFSTHYFELTRLADQLSEVQNVHLSAAEHARGVTFLHTVKSGPASKSYGLAVAKLAGVPPSVVAQAKQYLQSLEQHAASHVQQFDLFGAIEVAVDEAKEKSEPGSTLELSYAAQEPHPALAYLAAIDPNSLSPKAALDALYELVALQEKTR